MSSSIEVEFLDRSICESVDGLKESLSGVISGFDSEAEKFRGYRSSTIAFAATVIPIFLAIAALGTVSQSQQVILEVLCLSVASAAALVVLVFALYGSAHHNERLELQRQFSRICLALDHTRNMYRTLIIQREEINLNLKLNVTLENIISDFSSIFFQILQPAILHHILQLAEHLLDNETRNLYESLVKFGCQQGYRPGFFTTLTWTMCIQKNPDPLVKQLFNEFQDFCKSLQSTGKIQ